MSKHQKFRQKLRTVPTPADIRWTELQSFLEHLGFTMLTGSGSRRKFFHPKIDIMINLHEPHPAPIVGRNAIRDVVEYLESHGFLED